VPFDTTFEGRALLRHESGELLKFDLTLLGDAVNQLPYFVYAVLELGRLGLGRERGRFRLISVATLSVKCGDVHEVFDGAALQVPPPPMTAKDIIDAFFLHNQTELVIRFQTPTRLDLDGDLVFPITFHALMRALVNRITTLERFYGSPEGADPTEYAELLDAARGVRIVKNSQRWVDLERYSTRQKARLKMGGAVGEAVYECDDFTPFAPLLALGEWLHVGKLTTMGLGKFEVMRS